MTTARPGGAARPRPCLASIYTVNIKKTGYLLERKKKIFFFQYIIMRTSKTILKLGRQNINKNKEASRTRKL